MSQRPRNDLDIAIVGGGICGLVCAIALAREGIPSQVYEASGVFGEIGAGIGLGPNAIQVLRAIGIWDQVLDKIGEGGRPNRTAWVQFRSGGEGSELIYDYPFPPGEQGAGMHRAAFLEVLVNELDTRFIHCHMNKRCMKILQDESSPTTLTLRFADGTEANVNVVLGADGIKSVVRGAVTGSDPWNDIAFSGTSCYRALVPVEPLKAKGVQVDFVQRPQCFVGKDKHVLTFSIKGGQIINVVAPDPESPTVIPATPEELLAEFDGWGSDVMGLLSCVKKTDKWLINVVHPALESYVNGRIALLGDAAHAMLPHLGAGAGQGIEDAWLLAKLLSHEQTTAENVEDVLRAYNSVRRPRAQQVWEGSRRGGDIYELADQGNRVEVEEVRKQLIGLADFVWRHNIEDDVAAAHEQLRSLAVDKTPVQRISRDSHSGDVSSKRVDSAGHSIFACNTTDDQPMAPPQIQGPIPVNLGGGLRRTRKDISVGEVTGCLVMAGTVQHLEPCDMLSVVRRLDAEEPLRCGIHEVVIAVPLHVVYDHLSVSQMLDLGKKHGVRIGRVRTGAVVKAHLREHVCSPSCPLDFWLLRRPAHSVYNRIRFAREMANLEASAFVHPSQVCFAQPVDNLLPAELPVDDVPGSRRLHELSEESRSAAEPAQFPPRILALEEIADMIRGWRQDCTPAALAEGPCAVCAQLVSCKKLESMPLSASCFDILGEANCNTVPFAVSMTPSNLMCHAAVNHADGTANVCVTCRNNLQRQRRMPRMSLANGLWLGDVPEELQGLTFMEKQLIARFRQNHYVVNVTDDREPRKMRCNAVAFAQPVAKFYAVLPPPPSEVAEFIAVVFVGPTAPTEKEFKRVPLFVRRDKVFIALQWLKNNHCDYVDLDISIENLNMYPEHRPPVDWYYERSDGQMSATSLAVNESSGDRGDAEGPCNLYVHGVCPMEVAKMSYKTRQLVCARHLKQGGRIIGYGHSSEPESMFRNPKLLPGLYPWLFPYGLGRLGNPFASVGVPRRTHIRWFMNYHDRRFQVDETFPFLLFNQEQIRACSKGGITLTERKNYPQVVEKINSLNLDVMDEFVRKCKERGYVKTENDAEKECYSVVSMVDHVAAHVPWSGTRKKYQRNEIRSLIYECGLPLFFITFSPSESKNPVCLYLCGAPIDLDDFLPMELSEKERLKTVVSNPAACAKFFNLMVQLFIKHVLRADTNKDGLFGRTSAYYGTVEQQGRTTLHLHLLLWIAGAYSPQEIRDRAVDQSSTFAAEILSWLESCHQGEFSTGSEDDIRHRLFAKGRPSENEKSKTHEHGCGKRVGKTCRARFPRYPLYEYSFVELESGALRLKKGEMWLNTFSVVLTYLMRCNTDVTSLLSGTQVKAVIAYVTDYITKMSLKSYTIFETVLSVMKDSAKINANSATPGEAARRVITKVVNALIAQQELGGPMVCSDLMGFPDHYTNKRFQPMFWMSYVKRVSSPWCPSMAASAGNDSDEDLEADEKVMVVRKGSRLMSYSKVDDYSHRPRELSNMNLYDFFKWTEIVKATSAIRNKMTDRLALAWKRFRDGEVEERTVCGGEDPLEEDNEDWIVNDGGQYFDVAQDDDDDEENQSGGHADTREYFDFSPGHLKFGSHVVCVLPAKQWRVVNFVGPPLPRRNGTDNEAYCKTMLTFFRPWCSGLDLKSSDETWMNAYDSTVLDECHRGVIRNMNLLYECLDSRDDYASRRRQEENDENLPAFIPEDDMVEIEHAGQEGDALQFLSAAAYQDAAECEEENVGKQTRHHREQMDAMRDYFTALMDAGQCETTTDPPPSASTDIASHSPARWRDILVQTCTAVLKAKFETARVPSGAADGDMSDITPACKGDVSLLDESRYNKGMLTRRDRETQELSLRASREVAREVSKAYALNVEQRRAFMIAVHHVSARTDEPLHMYLGGMAGMGKSRVISALSTYFERRNESHRFMLMAPTGAAASIIGGSTFHSLLGLHQRGRTSLKDLAKIRDVFATVDIIFIDEISMVGCKDMYDISAQLANAFNLPLQSFAGKHVIVAGDFAQLPPPGTGSVPLYSSSVGLRASASHLNGQKNSLGRALWHHFTTVVILRENMRQRGVSETDRAFREALENMRYGRCTERDLALLRTRLVGREASQPTLNAEGFRDEALVVTWNTHRDAVNEARAEYFACQHGVPLEHFYSKDELKEFAVTDSFTGHVKWCKVEAKVNDGGMTDVLRQRLWDLPAAASKHIPGKLSLCIGMPVMLKHNEATELCATNGAEGFVVSWDSAVMKSGHNRLLTVFVRLKNPSQEVHIEGLPKNVVPVAYSSEKVQCTLPDDGLIKIMREQVQILPDFAMTDFGVQGRTRYYNPVDLSRCRGHQSVYTCLSRSSSLSGTLILRPFDEGKITRGASLDVQREMRELEILDDITHMRYDGMLPEGVVHRALNWRDAKQIELRPPVDAAEWRLAKAGSLNTDDGKASPVEEPLAAFKKARSDYNTDDPLGRVLRVGGDRQAHESPAVLQPLAKIGLTWDNTNWSCAYDALLTALWNTRQEHSCAWSCTVAANSVLNEIDRDFERVNDESVLTTTREHLREIASARDPINCPRRGQALTAIDALASMLFSSRIPYANSCWHCRSCSADMDFHAISSYVWSTAWNSRRPIRTSTVSVTQLLNTLIGDHGRRRCPACNARETLSCHTTFASNPPYIILEIPAEDSRYPTLTVDRFIRYELTGEMQTWALNAAIYLGGAHFTCRFITMDNVYYHDGIQMGNTCIEEIPGVDLATARGRKACLLIYALM
ncbi:hypothetical protein NM688_g1702 [Phlebia brevispora]|uniref:Uncharacterized protein n=1 Tax=Phlebia brevispora TaxID=194682 RepID=A0ACC1TB09_9APHY|nr:hypothetical protein NM688_g1702 [Phlebia brevispora]